MEGALLHIGFGFVTIVIGLLFLGYKNSKK